VPELAVSIVSYRTPGLLRQCLQAVATQADALSLSVTVVDNASGDGSAELVAAEFPWVRLIRNTRNVGYGVAHNQALRGAAAPYLLVLNADTAPLPGSLRTLTGALAAQPDVAVVGPRLRYPDGRLQPARRRFPTPATLFVESTQLQRFWPHHPLLRRFYFADVPEDTTASHEVDWLVGACLCVRTAAATAVGLFDERFFMYSEELDWCRRFRAAGWRVRYVPAAEVMHHEGASTRLDLAARDQRFQSSKLQYAAKWHGPRVARALWLYLLLEYLGRGLEESLKLALGSRPAQRRQRLRLIAGGLRHLVSDGPALR
jgi:GT2 family glycosyltransferase